MRTVGDFYETAYQERRKELGLRFDEILYVAEHIVEKQIRKRIPEYGDAIEVTYSPERLETALRSYFFDLHRYKHFHGMLDSGRGSNTNLQKKYSYTFKWVAKERPFYLDLDLGRVDNAKIGPFLKFSNYINELILLEWMKHSFSLLAKKPLELDKKERAKILYTLKYREFSTSIFELFLTTKGFPVPDAEQSEVL